MAKRGNALTRSKFVLKTNMGKAMSKSAGTSLRASRLLRNAAFGAAAVAGGMLAHGNVLGAAVGVAVGAGLGGASEVSGERAQMKRAKARMWERMAASRGAVAKGAAKRSGKAIQASNRPAGSGRVASAAPTGSNGQVKGYYRVQAGKSVFVQGYQRV